jgi:hypothetical protein
MRILTQLEQVSIKNHKFNLKNHKFLINICERDKKKKGVLPKSRRPIEVFAWGMNLGKTHQQNQFILQNMNYRHVYVVPTIALAREAAIRLSLPCYLDFSNNDSRWRESSMVVSMASYGKVRGAFDCLYIDESESCLEQLNSKDIFGSPLDTINTYSALVEDIRSCTKVALMDANASNATLQLVCDANRVDECQILECENDPITWVDMGSKSQHMSLLNQRLQKNNNLKMAIACSAKGDAVALYETLHLIFPHLDIRCFHGDNYEQERNRYLSSPYICDVLIYTNVIGSGVSIDVKDHYDERHVIICENTGNARTMMQMSQRVRNPNDQRVYFSGDNRTPKSTSLLGDCSAERILHDWSLAKEDSIRHLKTLNIEVSRHFDKDPKRMGLLHILSVIESSSIEHGKGWAATWLREHLHKVVLNTETIENEAEIKEQVRANRRRIKEQRAKKILETPEVSIEEIFEIEQKWSKSERDCHILEKHRLQNVFGNVFYECSTEEQLEMIVEDEHKKLTTKMRYFAAFDMATTEEGRDLLAVREADHLKKELEIHLSHTLQKSQLRRDILYRAGIDLQREENEIDRSKLEDAYWWASEQIDDLERLGLPTPPKTSKVKWLSLILDQIGIKLVCHKRPQQIVSIMTSPDLEETASEMHEGGGGFYNSPTKSGWEKKKKRQRLYHVDLKSVHRMKLLSQATQERWTKRYQDRVYILRNVVRYKNGASLKHSKMSMTDYYNTLEKVVDTHLKSLYYAEFKDRYGFIRPIRPAEYSLQEGLKPSYVEIDKKRWNEVMKNRERRGKKKTEIENWVESQMFKMKPIRFDKTVSTLRCPRRYPIIEDPDRRKEEGMLMLSSLPKELRSSFKTLSNRRLLDFDMKCANLYILASISKDDAMLSWLEGDPHQSTGDYLLLKKCPTLKKSERRTIGKKINNSLIAGAGEYWLKGLLKEKGVNISTKIAQSLHKNWWDRFPKAKEYRERHRKMLSTKVANGEEHSVVWYGKSMFYFDAELLNGQRMEDGWPKTVEKRQKKAERSAFTALLRGYESMIMDHVMIEARRLGGELVCPMFDGALFSFATVEEETGEHFALAAK